MGPSASKPQVAWTKYEIIGQRWAAVAWKSPPRRLGAGELPARAWRKPDSAPIVGRRIGRGEPRQGLGLAWVGGGRASHAHAKPARLARLGRTRAMAWLPRGPGLAPQSPKRRNRYAKTQSRTSKTNTRKGRSNRRAFSTWRSGARTTPGGAPTTQTAVNLGRFLAPSAITNNLRPLKSAGLQDGVTPVRLRHSAPRYVSGQGRRAARSMGPSGPRPSMACPPR